MYHFIKYSFPVSFVYSVNLRVFFSEKKLFVSIDYLRCIGLFFLSGLEIGRFTVLLFISVVYN
jgi:hypothetical protein